MDENKKDIKQYLKDIENKLKDSMENYVFKNDSSNLIRTLVDKCALNEYNETGHNIRVIGEETEGGKIDFKMFNI